MIATQSDRHPVRLHRRARPRRRAGVGPRTRWRCCSPTWRRCASPDGRRRPPRSRLTTPRQVHPAPEAVALFDGRRVGAPGAAFANGVLANVLDFDDGHRLTKGHPGAVVIPAALAVGQLVDASDAGLPDRGADRLRGGDPCGDRAPRPRSRLSRLRRVGRGRRRRGRRAVARAGRIAHDRGARTRRVPRADRADHAFVRRAADDQGRVRVGRRSRGQLGAAGGPGVQQRAARVPRCASSTISGTAGGWRSSTSRPTHAVAGRRARSPPGLPRAAGRPIAAGEIERVRVRTFAAADGLATVIPETTEEAQYSLVWPLAVRAGSRSLRCRRRPRPVLGSRRQGGV